MLASLVDRQAAAISTDLAVVPGADDAVLVADRTLDGGDGYTTAATLAAALRKLARRSRAVESLSVHLRTAILKEWLEPRSPGHVRAAGARERIGRLARLAAELVRATPWVP